MATAARGLQFIVAMVVNCKNVRITALLVTAIGVALAANPGPFNGGRCPNNRAVSGPCASYGDQCTYDDVKTGTHYCTCLVSSPSSPGLAGWSCH